MNDISDHKMIFTYIENTTYIEKIDKFIKIERKSQTAMVNFVEELRSMKICEHLNQKCERKPREQLLQICSFSEQCQRKTSST